MVGLTLDDLNAVWNHEIHRAKNDSILVVKTRAEALSRDLQSSKYVGMANFYAALLDCIDLILDNRAGQPAIPSPGTSSAAHAAMRASGHTRPANGEPRPETREIVLVPSAGVPVDDSPRQPQVRQNNTPDGTYTVAMPNGNHYTIELSTVTKGNLAGKRILSYLAGPDNETDFVGFAFVDGYYVNVWSRFKQSGLTGWVEAAKVVLGHPNRTEEFREAYAMASGRCAKCHRKLTVPASIHRGLGPECAKM